MSTPLDIENVGSAKTTPSGMVQPVVFMADVGKLTVTFGRTKNRIALEKSEIREQTVA